MNKVVSIAKRAVLDPGGLLAEVKLEKPEEEKDGEKEENEETQEDENNGFFQAILSGEYYPPNEKIRIILVIASFLTLLCPPCSIYLMLYATSYKEEVEKESYTKFLPSCVCCSVVTGVFCFPLSVLMAFVVWMLCIGFVPVIIVTERNESEKSLLDV